MSEADLDHLRGAAEEAARIAGRILLDAYGKVSYREKGPSDLVTDADHASQRAVAAFLAERFPDHTLLAEEEGAIPDPAVPWRWIVDPLDGTVNFAHSFPLWCVSIGLEHRGDLVVGVIHVPLTDTMYSAAKGRGATVDGRPMSVSRAARLSESLIVTGMPTNFGPDAERQLALFGRFSTGTHSVRRTGTTAWNMAQIAAGGCDVCYATAVNPWDVAAGVVLVREAGGLVTALDGGPYDLYSPVILAANPRVHGEAAAEARAVLERFPRTG